MLVEPRDDRAGVRPELRAETVWVGFQRQNGILRAYDFVFVDDPFVVFRDEEFPDSGIAPGAHGIDAAVPSVEIADDADAAGVGRPHGEVHASDAFECLHMGAESSVSVV